jgi:hypothetical protein
MYLLLILLICQYVVIYHLIFVIYNEYYIYIYKNKIYHKIY